MRARTKVMKGWDIVSRWISNTLVYLLVGLAYLASSPKIWDIV